MQIVETENMLQLSSS